MSEFKIVRLLNNPVQLVFSGGINLTGPYNPLTAYSTGDSVSYLGSSYAAIQSTTGNLPTDTTYWQLLAIKGGTGEFANTFETVSKNLKAYPYVLNYTSGVLTSIVYDLGAPLAITKTLNYTTGILTSIVLSGDLPSGIMTTKTLTYTGENLTSIVYS